VTSGGQFSRVVDTDEARIADLVARAAGDPGPSSDEIDT